MASITTDAMQARITRTNIETAISWERSSLGRLRRRFWFVDKRLRELQHEQDRLLERKLFHEMRLGVLEQKLTDAKPQRR